MTASLNVIHWLTWYCKLGIFYLITDKFAFVDAAARSVSESRQEVPEDVSGNIFRCHLLCSGTVIFNRLK